MKKALLQLTILCCIVVSIFANIAKAVMLPDASTERIQVATPSQDESRNYKYIPLGYGNQNDDLSPPTSVDFEDHETKPHTAPSEIVLTVLRTVLDVVRKVNSNRAENSEKQISKKLLETKIENDKIGPANVQDVLDATEQSVSKDESVIKDDEENHETVTEENESENKEDTTDESKGRGFDDYYDDHHHYHETTTTTTTPAPAKQSRFADPWTGYYDFIINEGSYKFWSAFQLFTAALLLYSCLAAIYYAKFNPVLQDYDTEYDDYFIGRSDRKVRSLANPRYLSPSGQRGLRSSTFMRILDAVSKEVL